MEFLTDYGLFLAKAVTIVAAILVVIAAAVASANKQRKEDKGTITVTHLNKEIDDFRDEIRKAVEDHHTLKEEHKAEKKKEKKEKKEEKARKKSGQGGDDGKKRLYVIDFNGDPKASQVDDLRQTITAILTMARPDRDEILLRLESPGGQVHAYGLAASQIHRIRNKNIPLTICVDKVAASGGYMMACLANRLIAAPFAYIGSIGVLIQLPNFNRLLKEKNVDFEMITSGEYKRTLTLFGENTEKGRQKMTEEVQEAHQLFKNFIKEFRQQMDMEKLGTGEAWFGNRALELGLIDEIGTSDACIVQACETADVYAVAYERKKKIADRLGKVIENAMDNILLRWLQRSNSKDDLIS